MSTPPDQLPPIPATPDLFIPQVPFKQLPFPWDDLTNTPQPDATQYYPDHAPSVVATLAGMHPTNQQGQTLNTDGDHALLVKNVGGSSGGVSPLPANGSDTQTQQILSGGDGLADFQGFEYIVGISVGACIVNWQDLPDGNTTANTVDFKFYNGYGFHSIYLGGYKSGTFWAGTFSGQEYVSFAYPIVPSGNDPDHAYPLAIEIKNNNLFDILATVSITGKLA